MTDKESDQIDEMVRDLRKLVHAYTGAMPGTEEFHNATGQWTVVPRHSSIKPDQFWNDVHFEGREKVIITGKTFKLFEIAWLRRKIDQAVEQQLQQRNERK